MTDIKIILKNQNPDTIEEIRKLVRESGYEDPLFVDIETNSGDSGIRVVTPCAPETGCELDDIEDILQKVKCERSMVDE
jgi:hypothetical protein